MKTPSRKKLNLTIEPEILEKARRLAEFRGSSISSLVQEFLSRLTSDMESSDKSHSPGDSIENFHKKYLKHRRSEPSDLKILAIKNERLNR